MTTVVAGPSSPATGRGPALTWRSASTPMATVTRAEPSVPRTIASTGAATSAGASDARTRALDAAFASAVTEAVADLAGKAARTQGAAVDREIVKRARRFVASFAVTAERPGADQLELDVDVRIDHDKVRARLLELGVELRAAPTRATVGDGALRSAGPTPVAITAPRPQSSVTPGASSTVSGAAAAGATASATASAARAITPTRWSPAAWT